MGEQRALNGLPTDAMCIQIDTDGGQKVNVVEGDEGCENGERILFCHLTHIGVNDPWFSEGIAVQAFCACILDVLDMFAWLSGKFPDWAGTSPFTLFILGDDVGLLGLVWLGIE